MNGKIEIKTKYITPDDFKIYTGIDLVAELDNGSNQSNKAQAFIYRIETRMSAYLNAEYFEEIDLMFPEFTDYQKEHYRLALLEQAIYIYRNGDLSVDSGYNYENGEISNTKTIKEKSIAPNAKQQLILCGLCDRTIYKGTDAGGYWWFL